MPGLKLKQEKTFILIKPDGVKRGLVGEILQRIEQRGLKIIALKMIQADKKKASSHYSGGESWLRDVGQKTIDDFIQIGLDPAKELGTDEAVEIGKLIKKRNTEFLISGPMVAAVVSGIHAVKMVRKLVGETLPYYSDVGTIRGDYSVDSAVTANRQNRSIRNLIHASGNEEEVEYETNLWFKPEEIHPYKRAEEDIMF